MTPKTKRLLHWVGSALAVASLVFVARRLWVHAGQMELAACTNEQWAIMGALGAAYCAANLCLPRLWSACLRGRGLFLPWRSALIIYGYSQIGKYLPGNIAHLAGRQALAMAENLPGKAVAASMLWEMALLALVAAGVFLPPALILFLRPDWPLALAACVFVCGCAAAPWVGRRLWVGPVCAGVCWALLFLCCMAGIWIVSLATVAKQDISPLWLGASAVWYVTAWLVGFVTPGAPAGLGMREATVLLLAKGAPIPEADLLLTSLCCRGISVVGDVGFFMIAVIARNKPDYT